MKRSPRTPANLSESVHQQLNMYALAASAAGVGILALASPAEGKIVYTPTHRVIHYGFTGIAYLDLNHDGIIDFKIENWWCCSTSVMVDSLSVLPSAPGNGIRGYGGTSIFAFDFASALRAGTRIGPKDVFISPRSNDWMYRAGFGWGQWHNVRNRYLGFKFAIKGTIHYGWARLNAYFDTKNYQIKAVLTGYAYETIPNKPIIAGKTKGRDDTGSPEWSALRNTAPRSATLGVLAKGAPGLSIWRRKESALRANK